MEYLKFTPELANDWKNALSASEPYLFKRVMDSMNQSQLESKLWIIQELIKLEIKPKRVAILAGWYAQYIVPLLYDNFESVEWVENFEIDQDVKRLSYKFNKRLKEDKKYRTLITNVMFDRIQSGMDTIINCACEHMYPMWKFRELNETFQKNPLYILQSSNDEQHEDHINCVNSEEELIDQARIKDVMYSGSKILSNKSTRFMVIGR
jgi:hypothetical protein|tara:strand:+ start:26 stop:649 length:624 start_codon:yes stop_codon:yes gene_type:complete